MRTWEVENNKNYAYSKRERMLNSGGKYARSNMSFGSHFLQLGTPIWRFLNRVKDEIRNEFSQCRNIRSNSHEVEGT